MSREVVTAQLLRLFSSRKAASGDAAGCFGVGSSVPGNVWKVLVETGTAVEAGQPVAIIESMKMEIPVVTKFAGELVEWLVAEGSSVLPGQYIAIIREKMHA